MKHRSTFSYFEPKAHGIPSFPIGIYNEILPENTRNFANLHYHYEFELTIATRGSVSVQVNENMLVLHEGEGVFINSSQLHAINATIPSESHYTAVVFSPELFGSKDDCIYQKYFRHLLNGALSVPVRLNEEQVAQIIEIDRLFIGREFGYEMLIKSNLLVILHELFTHFKEDIARKPNPRIGYIKKALAFIEDHYAEDITLNDLSVAVGLSREYFCRLFSELTDISPMDYLNNYRIKKSLEMLKTTDHTIAEICYRCGFHNCSYYNKMFRRIMGKSPSEYRKN